MVDVGLAETTALECEQGRRDMYCNKKIVVLLSTLFVVTGAGCACGPCGGTMAGNCSSGGCGPMQILANASCKSGCDEVYVDEWLSEPPTSDNCGYGCGCGRCGTRQPVRSALRLLWGNPYRGSCSDCDGGYQATSSIPRGADCGCGHDHGTTIMSAPPTPMPVPSSPPSPTEIVPTPNGVPTSAPSLNSASMKRLNPAGQRTPARTASSTRNR